MTRYSQNDEQDFILKFFEEFRSHWTVGRRLLDIGAFDGVTFSNTRALLERGWSGILIEPDPRNVVKLIENCVSLHVDIIAMAVGTGPGYKRLIMDATVDRGWASTISQRCLPGVLKPLSTRLQVPVLSPDNCTGPYDFISVDAEGMDFEILKALPQSTLYYCKLLCIEPHNSQEREQMREWLSNAGFKTAHETPENLIVCQK